MAYLATDGVKLYSAAMSKDELKVIITREDGRVYETPVCDEKLFDPRIAVHPQAGIAVIARTASARAFGCMVYDAKWTFLGPSNMPVGVRFEGVKPRYAFVGPIKSGVMYELTPGDSSSLVTTKVATSQGILDWDEPKQRWKIASNSDVTLVHDYKLIKAIYRDGWWLGQHVHPAGDRLLLVRASDGYAFRADKQRETPNLVVIGHRIIINGKIEFDARKLPPRESSSPIVTPAPAPKPTPAPEPLPVSADPTNLVPNYKPVVASAVKYYEQFDIPNRLLRAHLVINRAASVIPGAGLFYKTSGNRFNERSVDIIFVKSPKAPAGKALTFDVLKNAESETTPIWNSTYNPKEGATGFGDIAKWREPVDPDTLDRQFGLAVPTAPEPPAPVDPAPPNPAEPVASVAMILAAFDKARAEQAAELKAFEDRMNKRFDELFYLWK